MNASSAAIAAGRSSSFVPYALVSPVLKRAGRLVPKFGEATAFLESLQVRLACLRSTVGFASKPGTGWPSLW